MQIRQRDIISNEIYRGTCAQIFFKEGKTPYLIDEIPSPYARGLLKDHLHHRPSFQQTTRMKVARLTAIDSALDMLASSSAAPPLSTLSSAQRAAGSVAPTMVQATAPEPAAPPPPAATVLREYGNVTWVPLNANESREFWGDFYFPWTELY